MAVPEELGLELEQASQLLGLLGQAAQNHRQNLTTLQSNWTELQSALNATPSPDERIQALEQGSARLEQQALDTQQAQRDLQRLDPAALQSGISQGGSQIEQLAGQARRATELAGLETTQAALAESARVVDGHRHELRNAHEQSRRQALDCWESGLEGRARWHNSHEQTQRGVSETRQALQQAGSDFVEGALNGTLDWLDQHHGVGLKTVAGRIDDAAGALVNYLSQAAQSADSHGESSRDALRLVRAKAGEHQSDLQQALGKTLSALETSQGRTRQSSQTAQNAMAEAQRMSNLLGNVQEMSLLLDPKAWELP